MLFFILAGLISSSAQAQNCEPVKWVTPAVVSGGVYKGTLSVNCTLKKSNTDIRSITSGFEKIALSKAQSIHSGPVGDSLRGLAARKYDAMVKQ